MSWVLSVWGSLPFGLQVTIENLIKVLFILIPLLLFVAYMTLAERKIIGYIQVRIGPNRVGPRGMLQPFADLFKLVFKEIIIPSNANRALFLSAPVLALVPALTAWAVVPFTDKMVLANLDAGLLYILALTSLGVYGVIVAGWASNSKYAFLGAMRSAAQIVAYEIAMGFALVGLLMVSGSLNLVNIVNGQTGGLHQWYIWPLFPLFLVYFISGIAETNRLPFDVAEGESEIVAGYQVEYSGLSFMIFFLAEYANIILISTLAVIMFLGGWHAPLDIAPFNWIPPFFWLIGKITFFLFCFIWFRGTFPRYRYDQIMRLGWKVFIPITLVWITVIGVFRFLTPYGFIFR